jgi:hypothetical protein
VIHGAGVDEGQARTNKFAEIVPCPRCQAESDEVSLVRHCQWDGESQAVGCGRGAPCGPELRHRVDLWAVFAEGPDNRRCNPSGALASGPGVVIGGGRASGKRAASSFAAAEPRSGGGGGVDNEHAAPCSECAETLRA